MSAEDDPIFAMIFAEIEDSWRRIRMIMNALNNAQSRRSANRANVSNGQLSGSHHSSSGPNGMVISEETNAAPAASEVEENRQLVGLRSEATDVTVITQETNETTSTSEVEASRQLVGIPQEGTDEISASTASDAAPAVNSSATDLTDGAPPARKRKHASDEQAVPSRRNKPDDAAADVTSRVPEASVELPCEEEDASEHNDLAEQAQPEPEDNP